MLLRTKEKSFSAPSDQVLENTAFGILWDGGKQTVISTFQWSGFVSKSGPYLNKCVLRDKHGEIRPIGNESYHEAIEFASWEAYDQELCKRKLLETNRQLADLRKLSERSRAETVELRCLLAQIYKINERGGGGSRKAVRNLISALGIPEELEEDC